ncbi:MAG: hypothetical protein Q9168_004042 [Polycauliona sp. 1 TL-2023]
MSNRLTAVGFDPHADEDLSLTANLYWSMVESGLGLVAVCLPTFRALFGKSSLDAMVHRFRSTFSLRSRTSQRGWLSRNSESRIELSGGSSERFKQDQTGSFETYAVCESELQRKDKVQDGKIHVQSSIGQTEDWA